MNTEQKLSIKTYTVICIAWDKKSIMIIEVEASNITIAKKASEHVSDMETGCGPYEACLILNGTLEGHLSANEINGCGHVFELSNGDEYVARNKL